MTDRVIAVILASGSGERAGHYLPKQFIKIAGKTVLEHTLDVFDHHSLIQEIIIVGHPDFRNTFETILEKNTYKKIRKLLNGGATRQESSRIALSCIFDDTAKVIVHDAVRPFVSDTIIRHCVEALDLYNAVDVAIPSSDTIIRVDESRCIADIPKRLEMYRGQTPQAFRAGILKQAHALAEAEHAQSFTDDCGLIVKYRLSPVFVVDGEQKNIKITYPEDIVLADKLFQLNALEQCDNADLSGLVDKVVIIFGASKGIGKATADLARSHGARVFGFSKSEGCDIGSIDEVMQSFQAVYAETKRIDFVVNTAGVLNLGKVESRNMSDIEQEIRTNYLGAIQVIQSAIPYLKETRGALLLFTSSSYTRGRALYSVYSSTKAAVVNLAQAISEELFQDNVRINTINPERTATPMRFSNFGNEPKESLLQPEKVAQVSLATLLSDLTGQVINVTR